MNVLFLDHQDTDNPWNGHGMSLEEAVALLRASRRRSPFLCSLEGERGTALIGVAAEVGCVQFTPASGGPPYLMAVGDFPEAGEAAFLSGGTPSPIPARHVLTWPRLEQVVSSVLEHGVTAAGIHWEAV